MEENPQQESGAADGQCPGSGNGSEKGRWRRRRSAAAAAATVVVVIVIVIGAALVVAIAVAHRSSTSASWSSSTSTLTSSSSFSSVRRGGSSSSSSFRNDDGGRGGGDLLQSEQKLRRPLRRLEQQLDDDDRERERPSIAEAGAGGGVISNLPISGQGGVYFDEGMPMPMPVLYEDKCYNKGGLECAEHPMCELRGDKCVHVPVDGGGGGGAGAANLPYPADGSVGGVTGGVTPLPSDYGDGSSSCAGKGKRECKRDKGCKYIKNKMKKATTIGEGGGDSKRRVEGHCAAKEGNEPPPSSDKPMKYWPRKTEAGHECVRSSDYPDFYLTLKRPILFKTYRECCDAYSPCVSSGNDVVVTTSEPTPPAGTEPSEPGDDGPTTTSTVRPAQGCDIPRTTNDPAASLQSTCEPGEFCRLLAGTCNDELDYYARTATNGMTTTPRRIGTCAPRPTACPMDYDPVCGCDGRTHSNACMAEMAGTSVAVRGECGGGAIPIPVDPTQPSAGITEPTGPGGGGAKPARECALKSGATDAPSLQSTCGPGESCILDAGACNSRSATHFGACAPVGPHHACAEIYMPVCGCDGETYVNACAARAAGRSVSRDGSCDDDDDDDKGGVGQGPTNPVDPVPGDPIIPNPGPSVKCTTGGGGPAPTGDAPTCPDDEFCMLDAGECRHGHSDDVHHGYCASKATAACPVDDDDKHFPVCGCDGKTYQNPCLARKAGVSVSMFGACDTDDGDDGGSEPAPPPFPGDIAGPGDITSPPVVVVERCTMRWGSYSSEASRSTCPDGEFCILKMGDCDNEPAFHSGICAPMLAGCPRHLEPVCGCDGTTYDNSCMASIEGVSVSRRGECDRSLPTKPSVPLPGNVDPTVPAGDPRSAKECAVVRATATHPSHTTACPDDEFCSLEAGACDSDVSIHYGVCVPRPFLCTMEHDPVCGCDGRTYGNACGAASHGASVSRVGECAPANDSGDIGVEPDIPGTGGVLPTPPPSSSWPGGDGCPGGSCLSPDGRCAPQARCLVDPCSTAKCGAGTACEANYCGGCHAACVPLLAGGDGDSGATVATTGSATVSTVAIVVTSAPPEECPRGSCLSPDGRCGPQVRCSVDPCSTSKCRAGTVCEANYCGGCHATCVLSLSGGDGDGATGATKPSAASTATATSDNATGGPQGPPVTREPHWWPSESTQTGDRRCVYSSDYPDSYVEISSITLLFESEEECCMRYNICPATAGTTTTAPKVEYWYPHSANAWSRNCIRDADYPDEFLNNEDMRASLLFESELDCCMAFPSACMHMLWHPSEDGTGCVYGNVPLDEWADEERLFTTEDDCCERWCGAGSETSSTSSTGATPATTKMAKSALPTECAWHTHSSGLNTCTNSPDYPRAWDDLPSIYRQYYFFASAEDCCENSNFGEACIVVDECAGDGVASAEKTLRDCDWHMHLEDHFTCTNSERYPDRWNEVDTRTHMLFATSRDCCETRFPDQECTILNECTHEYIPLKLGDDLSGGNIPWEWGDPTQWFIDDTVSVSSEGEGESLTNIPVTEPGATSDLTLKIHVTHHAMLRCMARIDVKMPFDMFVVLVNGEPRYQFGEPIVSDGKEWMELKTWFSRGYKEIIFRVLNSEYGADFDGGENGGYGSGRVWLDQCQIISHW